LNEAEMRRLRQGQVVVLADPLHDGVTRVYCGNEFIGVGEIKSGTALAAKRLLSY
jgi:hypothetical protein